MHGVILLLPHFSSKNPVMTCSKKCARQRLLLGLQDRPFTAQPEITTNNSYAVAPLNCHLNSAYTIPINFFDIILILTCRLLFGQVSVPLSLSFKDIYKFVTMIHQYIRCISGHYRPSCFYLKQNVSETGVCLRLQVDANELGPIDRSRPWHVLVQVSLSSDWLHQLAPTEQSSPEDRIQSPKHCVLNKNRLSHTLACYIPHHAPLYISSWVFSRNVECKIQLWI
jgi:hypothetical protein